MVSKRGMLAVDEIIKLVLGVAVFIFILFILFFFGKMVGNTLHEEQAKNALDNLVYELKGLKDGQSKEILIEGPKDWMLLQIPSTDKICICPADYLSKIGNKEDIDTNRLYSYCSASAVKCLEVKGVSNLGGLNNFVRDQSTLKNSVCYTKYLVPSFHYFYPIDKCILFSFIPMTIKVNNVQGVLTILPVDKVSLTKLANLDSFSKAINNLKDGETITHDLSGFKDKNIYVAQDKIWICTPPKFYLNDNFLIRCSNEGNSTFVRRELNLSISGGKTKEFTDALVYYQLLKSGSSDVSISRKGNDVVLSILIK